MQYPKTDVCKTISEAVEQLMRSLDRGDLERIRAMDEEDIPLLHFGLAQYIRDHFKLWHEKVHCSGTAVLKKCMRMMQAQ